MDRIANHIFCSFFKDYLSYVKLVHRTNERKLSEGQTNCALFTIASVFICSHAECLLRSPAFLPSYWKLRLKTSH